MGSVPAKDPVEEVRSSLQKVSEKDEIHWDSRAVRRPWGVTALLFIVTTIAVQVAPSLVLLLLILVVCAVVLTRTVLATVDERLLMQHGWRRVDQVIPELSPLDGHILVRGKDEGWYLSAMSLRDPGSRLYGDLARVVRGIPTDAGVCLLVSMHPSNTDILRESEYISGSMGNMLDRMSDDKMSSYVSSLSGLWSVSVNMIGHTSTVPALAVVESAVRGTVPTAGWSLLSAASLAESVRSLSLFSGAGTFYALGKELSMWLVQMRTELASEVGATVPGQFLAPIRSREGEYQIGNVLNPDTLEVGPRTGLLQDEIDSGLVVCGGTHEDRLRVIALLVRGMLSAGMSVLLVTGDPTSSRLATLSDDSVFVVLGEDLILNPVDAERVSRVEYVPRLMSALEVVSGTELTNAPDLELALSRAVAAGGATLADVSLSALDDTGPGSDRPERAMGHPNSASQSGIDAIRTLYQGSCARAFYGSTSIPVERLTEHRLTIAVLSLESVPLEMFAWDLLCLKMTGLSPRRDTVLIMDEPRNMLVNGGRFSRRSKWVDELIESLRSRFSVILSVARPSEMPDGLLSRMSACVSLRLESKSDIAAASDLLGLKVIETGLHSKARWSARESSYLRVLGDGLALMTRSGNETCLPVRLDPSPITVSPDLSRVQRLTAVRGPSEDQSGGLLKRVAGRDYELAKQVLELLERYEPLTEVAVQKFISASRSPESESHDVHGILARLENASMILQGHETHSGVTYRNFRITMKGRMALRQAEKEGS